MVSAVNIVASGSLSVELDLERLANDIDGPIAHYDPDKYPGMYLRFGENGSLITVYRTGKFIISGADSEEEVYSLRERFLGLFSQMNVIEGPDDEYFDIQNYVCTGELDKNLELNTLALELGLENTEYEPEQFHGLIYRPMDADCVLLLFATGKVVIAGSPAMEIAENAFKEIEGRIAETDSDD